jgi:hypothetical protein
MAIDDATVGCVQRCERVCAKVREGIYESVCTSACIRSAQSVYESVVYESGRVCTRAPLLVSRTPVLCHVIVATRARSDQPPLLIGMLHIIEHVIGVHVAIFVGSVGVIHDLTAEEQEGRRGQV